MLLSAVYFLFLDNSAEGKSTADRLGLRICKDLVFLNSAASAAFGDSDERGVMAYKYEQAFSSVSVTKGIVYKTSCKAKSLSPIKIVKKEAFKGLEDGKPSMIRCGLDLRQSPFEIYLFPKNAVSLEKITILTIDSMKKNRFLDDILFMPDPEKYYFCVRSRQLANQDRFGGILKPESVRMLSPTRSDSVIQSPFSCKFKLPGETLSASSRDLTNLLQASPSKKTAYRVTRSSNFNSTLIGVENGSSQNIAWVAKSKHQTSKSLTGVAILPQLKDRSSKQSSEGMQGSRGPAQKAKVFSISHRKL